MKAIEVNRVSKYYRQGILEKQISAVIKDVQFTVDKGKVFGLLGPNNAGKTSMIKLMSGLLSPTQGDIYILGHSITHEITKIRNHIGVFLGGHRNLFWPLTVSENLMFYGKLRSLSSTRLQRQIDKMVDLFQLEKIIHNRVSELSTEDLHKVSLATNLIHDPKILLLDEPTYGLDAQTTEQISQIIRFIVSDGEKTVFLTTTDIQLIQELCDQFLFIRNGQIDNSIDEKVLEELKHAATFFIEGDFQELLSNGGIFSEHIKDHILHYEFLNQHMMRLTVKSAIELAEILTYLLDKQFLLRNIRKNKIYLQDILYNSNGLFRKSNVNL